MLKKKNLANTQKSAPKTQLPAWDLSDLYKGIKDPQIAKDLATYKKSALDFAKKYKGKIAKLSPSGFAKMAADCEARSVLGNKLGVFAYLSMVTQMKNATVMSFYQNISEQLNQRMVKR